MNSAMYLLLMWVFILLGHLVGNHAIDCDDDFEYYTYETITIILYVVGVGFGIYSVCSAF